MLPEVASRKRLARACALPASPWLMATAFTVTSPEIETEACVMSALAVAMAFPPPWLLAVARRRENESGARRGGDLAGSGTEIGRIGGDLDSAPDMNRTCAGRRVQREVGIGQRRRAILFDGVRRHSNIAAGDGPIE